MSDNTKKKRKVILLVDTSALIYRCGFAIKDITNNKNEPLGGIFGFIRIMFKVSRMFDIHCVLCAGDSSENNRKKEYVSYKATRGKTPDFILQQLIGIRSVLNAMNIPFIQHIGYEADDIIGSLDRQLQQHKDTNVKILTIDQDLGQLISDNTHLVLMTNFGMREFNNAENFFEEKGILPLQYPDYIGLVGDTSDNIPGVRGIGNKTAVKLLEKYCSLESIFHNISLINEPIKSKLVNGYSDAILSKRLATINREININKMEIKKNNHEEWKSNNELVIFLKDDIGFSQDIINSFLRW